MTENKKSAVKIHREFPPHFSSSNYRLLSACLISGVVYKRCLYK